MGSQLVGLSLGCKLYKLKYGNRGHNQPCTHVETKRCFITSQNHGFALDTSTLHSGWLILSSIIQFPKIQLLILKLYFQGHQINTALRGKIQIVGFIIIQIG